MPGERAQGELLVAWIVLREQDPAWIGHASSLRSDPPSVK
jgi:hypothetical protein